MRVADTHNAGVALRSSSHSPVLNLCNHGESLRQIRAFGQLDVRGALFHVAGCSLILRYSNHDFLFNKGEE
jgi:hypothetical protein